MVKRIPSNDEVYKRQLRESLNSAKIKLNKTWADYREAKKNFYELLNDPRYLQGKDQGSIAWFIISLLVVYFLDLLFGWQVAEHMASQAFHNQLWAVYGATLLFPLAYVLFEVFVNYQTHMAKRMTDLYARSKERKLAWYFCLTVSFSLATVMPGLYISTGLAGVAKTGNMVFLILLGGLTLLAFLVHVMMIFAGDHMIDAKEQLRLLLDYKHRKKKMQNYYYGVMYSSGALNSLEMDYNDFCDGSELFHRSEIPSDLLIYIEIYIAKDYHHRPYGEEPPMNSPPSAGLLVAG